MANARLGAYLFDVNPHTVSWGYTMNVNTKSTYGGRIIQILNFHINEITLKGHIPQGFGTQYESMERVEQIVKDMMDEQLETKRPFRFSMPILGIEGSVYIKSFGSIDYDYKLVAPSYTMTLLVDSGFSYIKSAQQNTAVTSMFGATHNGVGVVAGVYNTPSTTSWETVLSVLQLLYGEDDSYKSMTLLELFNAASMAASNAGLVTAEQQADTDFVGGLWANADAEYYTEVDWSLYPTSGSFGQFALDYFEKQLGITYDLTGIVAAIDTGGKYTVRFVTSIVNETDAEGNATSYYEKTFDISSSVWDKLIGTWQLHRHEAYSLGNTTASAAFTDEQAWSMLGVTPWVESSKTTKRLVSPGTYDFFGRELSAPVYKDDTVWEYTPKYGDGAAKTKQARWKL